MPYLNIKVLILLYKKSRMMNFHIAHLFKMISTKIKKSNSLPS